MQTKIKEKETAIRLRKSGKTYTEILKQVPVAKSTLSIWLREVGLAKAQKQRLSLKKKEGQLKGAASRRRVRQESTLSVYTEAAGEVGLLSKRELLFIGAALYWAEGSKEKAGNPGQRIDFGNTDSEMIKLFVRWLQEILEVEPKDISYSLYVHKSHKRRVDEIIKYWKIAAQLPNADISQIYFKKNNLAPKRKNVGENYHGTLRIRVKKSSTLQRRIRGWIYGITGAPYAIL